MKTYDFSHLSAYEFELLVRDLLQQHLSINLESFKQGKDGGIDLKYCSATCGTMIVQCKRYVESDINELYRACRNDAVNVAKLKPSRYLLCTSLGLLPQHKTKIQKIFSPHCLSTSDIYGKEDLNNILSQHQKIEIAHHKLWLHSFELLVTLQNAGIINFSQAEVDRIESKRHLYVPTKNFDDALKILQSHRYCVITGIPGIGKTTLAEMLALAHATHGYQIIKISEDINEAFSVYNREIKQLFYYDDFLGQTGLQAKLGKNEDDRLISFINLVTNSTNARFVMTTREYILKQAQTDYERLSRFDFMRCVLEPPKYTLYQRARILYNHLFFSSLPQSYKSAVLAKQSYLKVIEHRGFNPRLISLLTDQKTIADIPSEKYIEHFINYLDNPEQIWKHAFEHQISQAAKNLLLVLTTLPPRTLHGDLENAFSKFHKFRVVRYLQHSTPQDFQNALREMEDTFLRIEKTDAEDDVTVSFHNPSVRDFMESFLAANQKDTLELVEAAEFFEQLEFLCSPKAESKLRIIRQHSFKSEKLAEVFIATFPVKSARLERPWDNTANDWVERRHSWSRTERLCLLSTVAETNKHSRLRLLQFIGEELHSLREQLAIENIDKEELISLLKTLSYDAYNQVPETIREDFLETCQLYLSDDLSDFWDFKLVAESIEEDSFWMDNAISSVRYQFETFFKTESPYLYCEEDFEDRIQTMKKIAETLSAFLGDTVFEDLEEERKKYLDQEENNQGRITVSNSRHQDPKTEIQKEIRSMFEGLI